MNNFLDLTGEKFNRLSVICRDVDYIVPKSGRHKAQWKCKCECGNICIVREDGLRNGHAKSCGCYNRQRTKESHTIHGKSHDRIYKIWVGIKGRCLNPNDDGYKIYGGRGIIICDKWKNNFMSFYYWALNNGYSENLTIERINVNGNYEPSNCTWIPNSKQGGNKRNTIRINYKEQNYTLRELSELFKINHRTLRYRWCNNVQLDLPVKMRNAPKLKL